MASNVELRTGGPVAGVEVVDVARDLDVDPAQGLSADEARSRLASHGPNRLAAGKKEPGWRAFLRQYEDFMQIVLLAAAVVNQIVTGETGTTVVLAGLTVFNAVIGLRQESKAEESVKALVADDEDDRPGTSRRPGGRDRRRGAGARATSCWSRPATGCPPTGGSVVAATLEIEEAALTGESLPVGKSTDPVPGRGRPAGRPDLHGLHEHLGHPRPRRADRHRHRHGHRDRPHRRHARQHRDRARRRCRSSSTRCRRSSRRSPAVALVHRRAARAWLAASRSTRCSSPASRSPWPRSRPGCRPW